MTEFNINVFSEDAQFCSALAIECDKYGFELTFFEERDIEALIRNKQYSVVLVDLASAKSKDPYELGKYIQASSNIPVFGLLDELIRKHQNKAKECGFDLVFTKSILLRSIKDIIIHITDK